MQEQQLKCTRCGKELRAAEAEMGQPLITAGEIVRTATKNPAMLFGPALPEVPYCATCRPLVLKQRSREAIKFLLGLLAVLGLILLIVIFVLP